MTLGSLFDGISGFPLAASWCGIETKWISEIDPYCLKVSKKNFPNAIQYGDIKELHSPGYTDIISGGFPCQPFSVAGNKKGKGDDRYLWPEMLRVIKEVKPRWVVGENVPGIINMALDEVLASLEDEGYQTETFIIPACGINAPHKRNRVWIIANSINNNRRSAQGNGDEKGEWVFGKPERLSEIRTTTNSNNTGLQGSENERSLGEIGKDRDKQPTGLFQPNWENFPTQSGICGRNDGIPNRVDRIKALGNAIVPQVAYEIFKAIKEIEGV